MFSNKRQREDPEINGSSLADIAFLLLIFFLVTTTIDVDTGIGLVLPPEPEENVDPPPVKERNMLKILVNAQGMILINEKPSAIGEVKQKVKDFVSNRGEDPNLSESPEKAIVSIKTDRQTPYKIYVDMLDEVMGAYRELRDQAALARYGKRFTQMEEDTPSHTAIKNLIPKKISEAEPDEG
ncbi:MAG: ExbD/TolR family protein [Bacteroidota bacterium]